MPPRLCHRNGFSRALLLTITLSPPESDSGVGLSPGHALEPRWQGRRGKGAVRDFRFFTRTIRTLPPSTSAHKTEHFPSAGCRAADTVTNVLSRWDACARARARTGQGCAWPQMSSAAKGTDLGIPPQLTHACAFLPGHVRPVRASVFPSVNGENNTHLMKR